MTGPDFEHFCRLVYERSGLVLGPDKAYLVHGRLDPLAQTSGFAGAVPLLAHIRQAAPPALIEAAVNALATHESSFFRDGAPFELLKSQVLPPLLAARRSQRNLRILCAACSSGQEPYSVAMTLKELSEPLSAWRVDIMAVDFSQPILNKAQAGLYSDFEVRRGLSPERLERWFHRQGESWRISDELRQMVTFRRHNLLNGMGGLGTFDVIFCRNVLIYFDLERKRTVLTSLSKALAPDGALFLGSAESIFGIECGLQSAPGGRGLLRPIGSDGATAIRRGA